LAADLLANLSVMARASVGPEDDESGQPTVVHGVAPSVVHVAPPGAPVELDVPATAGQGATWMLLAAMGFLAGQVMSAVLLLVVAVLNGHAHDLARLATLTVPPAWVVVSGLGGLWIGFIGAVVVASRSAGTGNVRRDMRVGFRPSDLVVGPLVGLGGQFVLLPVLYLPLERVVPHLSDKLAQPAKHLTGGFPGGDLAVIAVLTVLVVPVVEELVFRGLFLRGALRLLRGAGPALGPALSVVCTGVVFGLAHLELLQFLGLAAFGMVLSYMAYRVGRLGPCMVAHATFNLVAILAVATVVPTR